MGGCIDTKPLLFPLCSLKSNGLRDAKDKEAIKEAAGSKVTVQL